MGKKLLKHMLVVGAILIALGIIDWVIYLITGTPVLCLKSSGGECITYTGLWYQITKIYPEVQANEQSLYITEAFLPLFGVLALIVITAVSMIPLKRRNGKQNS